MLERELLAAAAAERNVRSIWVVIGGRIGANALHAPGWMQSIALDYEARSDMVLLAPAADLRIGIIGCVLCEWVLSELLVVCLGDLMIVLDATIVNVALPSIQDDLGFSNSSLAWVVNAYVLVFGGFLLLGGRLADIVGRRRIFMAGLVVFAVGSLLGGLSTSAGTLLAARALQGLGASAARDDDERAAVSVFARDDDDLWALSESALKALAVREMQQLGLADEAELLDATVLRQPKAYPGYFGAAFQRFDALRGWLDGLSNLYLCGRNGMHRYNNQDHSMLSARLAAQAILNGGAGREAIWAVNIDDAYHEEAPTKA